MVENQRTHLHLRELWDSCQHMTQQLCSLRRVWPACAVQSPAHLAVPPSAGWQESQLKGHRFQRSALPPPEAPVTPAELQREGWAPASWSAACRKSMFCPFLILLHDPSVKIITEGEAVHFSSWLLWDHLWKEVNTKTNTILDCCWCALVFKAVSSPFLSAQSLWRDRKYPMRLRCEFIWARKSLTSKQAENLV